MTRWIVLVVGAALVGCGGAENEPRADAAPCPAPDPELDASAPDAANIVDECVDTLHSEYACVMAQLPTVYTAIGCKGTPKLMHPEDGTLIGRPDGREGCIESTNYKGERLTCCPACGAGRVPCAGGGCCAQ